MEILQQFGIQPILLLAQIVNFLIILFLLKKFFYKPIVRVLEERKKRIEESLKNADLIDEKLKDTEERTAKILDEARGQAQSIITDAKQESQKIFEKTSLDAKLASQETLKQTALQIEKQKEEMQKSLEKETITLVIDVVNKVLGRILKPKEKTELTQKAVSQITKQIQ